MAATGKTPILLYGSSIATNTPSAGNLTNSSDGCEIAINVADKNLFFKDSTNVVNTVPIRQSGTSSNGWLSSTDWNTFNDKASTSSPTFLGDVTVSTGNLVIGTSGKGIDFSATLGTGTSELLADYEEGTWTPTLTPTSGSLTSYTSSGKYTKVGNLVTIEGIVRITNVGTAGGGMIIGGVPYIPNTGLGEFAGVAREKQSTGVLYQIVAGDGSASMTIYTLTNGSPLWANSYYYSFVLTYTTS